MKAMELQKAGKELIFTNGAPLRAGHLGKGACCRSSAAAAAAARTPPARRPSLPLPPSWRYLPNFSLAFLPTHS